MPIVLIVGWLAVAPIGCVTGGGGKVEYIPADRAVVAVKKGEPAPNDGWFIPPAVLQEMIPCLDERFRRSETVRPNPPLPAETTPSSSSSSLLLSPDSPSSSPSPSPKAQP